MKDLYDVIGNMLADNSDIDNEWPCDKCGTFLVNVETQPDVHMQCPKCGWEPITLNVVSREEIEGI